MALDDGLVKHLIVYLSNGDHKILTEQAAGQNMEPGDYAAKLLLEGLNGPPVWLKGFMEKATCRHAMAILADCASSGAGRDTDHLG